MSAAELLAELRAAGVEVKADGNRILARPAGALTAAQRQELARHKAEVVALLGRGATDGEHAEDAEPAPRRLTLVSPDGY